MTESQASEVLRLVQSCKEILTHAKLRVAPGVDAQPDETDSGTTQALELYEQLRDAMKPWETDSAWQYAALEVVSVFRRHPAVDAFKVRIWRESALDDQGRAYTYNMANFSDVTLNPDYVSAAERNEPKPDDSFHSIIGAPYTSDEACDILNREPYVENAFSDLIAMGLIDTDATLAAKRSEWAQWIDAAHTIDAADMVPILQAAINA